MKILLLNPVLLKNKGYRVIPFGLAHICSYLKFKGIKFDLVDANINKLKHEDVLKIISENKYDAVFTGGMHAVYSWLKELFAGIKLLNPGIKIIVGGPWLQPCRKWH